MTRKGEGAEPGARPGTGPGTGSVRSFKFNSEEAYEALCPRQEWSVLPREPRIWDLPVVVEETGGRRGKR